MEELKYTGERFVSGEKNLLPIRVENLARYRFLVHWIQGKKIFDMDCGDGVGSGFLRGYCD